MKNKNKKVYIAGKISGLPIAEYTAKFSKAVSHLETLGYEAVNPVEHCNVDMEWADCVIKCLQLLRECEGIYLLGDWQDSHGAVIEHAFFRKMATQNEDFIIMKQGEDWNKWAT